MDRIHRFGVFQFDAGQLELRRDGQVVRLQRQPAQVLAVLVEHAGRLVTRDELRNAIWGNETFVDFDRGLNFCIAQIRTAVGDDAGTPRYVRTIPKRGYEFICPVETARPATVSGNGPSEETPPIFRRRRSIVLGGLAAAAAAVLVVYARGAGTSRRVIVAVARFDNETGDPLLTRFSDYLTDNVVEQLTATSAGTYEVVGNAAILRGARETRDLNEVAASLHANYVVLGQVQRDADQIRVLGHLIRLPDQTHVAVARFDDVRDQTLAKTTEIAVRMTERFARRLKGPERPVSP